MTIKKIEHEFKRMVDTGLIKTDANGNKMVEIINAHFKANQPYIFGKDLEYEMSEEDWYTKNYDPIIAPQIPKVIDELAEHPTSRRAVLQLFSRDEWSGINSTHFLCTNNIQLFLIDLNGNEHYELVYIVNMRSCNAHEYRNDYQWHYNNYIKFVNMLKEKGLDVSYYNKPTIYWNAGSLHVYESEFEYLT